MTTSTDAVSFFDLPLEIREQIYREVLCNASQRPALLQTCREVYDEAYKYIFQRPISFSSQGHLYSWIDHIEQPYLTNVHQICLDIQDIDLHHLLQRDLTTEHLHHPARLSSLDAYEQDLQNLKQALSKLPNVKTIIVRALAGRQSYMYRQYLAKFMEMVASLYPNLSGLCLEGNMQHQSLNFMTRMKNIHSFSFDGFCASSATEAASLLSSLLQLKNLSLVSQQCMPESTGTASSTFTPNRQSITGEFIYSRRQLSKFSAAEHALHPPNPLFFTPEVLEAIRTHKTLTSLFLSFEYTPNNETLQSIQDLLEGSKIEELELDWSALQTQTFESYSLIPNHIKDLRIRANSAADAANMIRFLVENRKNGVYSSLRTIGFVRAQSYHDEFKVQLLGRKNSTTNPTIWEVPEHNTASGEHSLIDIAQWKEKLKNLGVQATWFTECP